MSIDETLYKFKLEYDKIDTQKRFNLSIPQQLIFLNEGQRRVVNRKYTTGNIRKEGFEQAQKRIRELQKLVMPTEQLTTTVIDTKTYSVDLTTLSSELLYIIRSQSTAAKGDCSAELLDNFEAKHNDLNNILRDPYQKPSFEWRETPIIYKHDTMLILSDGTFTVSKADIDYIRWPVSMDKAGYTHFDGTTSTSVDPELPDYVVDEIITEAVILASNPIEEAKLAQPNQIKQATAE